MNSLFVVTLINYLDMVVGYGIVHNAFALPGAFIITAYIVHIRLTWAKSLRVYRLGAIKATINILHGLARIASLTTWCHQSNGHQDKQGLFHNTKIYKHFINKQTRIA